MQIVYSRRKTVALSVERDASVIVRAPEGMAEEKIHVAGVGFQSRFEISRKNQPRAAELFKLWYLRQAEERIPPRAKYFAEALGVGFNRIYISDLKVRWGSCTPKSNLNFNWRLMKAPSTVIDYVIVDELAHLIEPNHTQQFWNIVSIQVPRFNWAKQWLREHGDLLETDF